MNTLSNVISNEYHEQVSKQMFSNKIFIYIFIHFKRKSLLNSIVSYNKCINIHYIN